MKDLHSFRRSGKLSEEAPENKGVYMAMRDSVLPPVFVEKGTGGYFKRKNSNVQVYELKVQTTPDQIPS